MGFFDFFKKKTSSLKKPLDKCIIRELQTTQQISIDPISEKVKADKVDLDTLTIESLRSRFIAFDVETTGFSASSDRIVELGAVCFENGVPVSSFGTLVNPGREIPPAASKVNHITNEMLKDSPNEDKVYQEFVEYLGDAACGKVIMCAHNARFDFDFLTNTLSRLGINAQFKYVDTLSLARCYIAGLQNYKQCTISAFIGLNNVSEHRAESDAEICGKILCRILECAEKEVEDEKKKIENSTPTQDELEVCAYIQKGLIDRGADISSLRYRKNSNNYVDITCLYKCLSFKYNKKGKYIIVPKNIINEENFPIESCTASEGGADYQRVYFNSPYDLEPFMDYIYKCFKDSYQSMREYISNSNYAKHAAEESIRTLKSLSENDVQELLNIACNKKYNESSVNVIVDPIIARSDVIIRAVHNRCPLENIKNLDNWEKGFAEGYKFWLKGDAARKEGEIYKAIEYYDKARYNGYESPALYESYAIAYRQLKDYDNEIDIIEEFLARKTYGKDSVFKARRDKAISLLYKKQQQEYSIAEKAATKNQKELEKQKEISSLKQRKGRTILQMTDDGGIVREYETVVAAANEVGVSTKCISDAAQGVQKHAGGYCWKYKD